MMKAVVATLLVSFIVVGVMAMQGEAVDCGQVTHSIATCMPFLMGEEAAPSTSCCSGVTDLKRLAPTATDRRATCECIKTAAAHYPTIKDDAASSLPKKCGVDINIPISKTTNCQAVN